jgi:hypothetical protein
MAYEVAIERGKIREFARATMSRNADYEGAAAVSMPTFLTTARLFWEPAGASPFRDLGLDLKRTLHAGEEFIFHGPPPQAGQVLTAESHLADQFEKVGRRGGLLRFATVVTEFTDASGRLVAEQRTTVVETSHPPKEDGQ